MSSTNQALGPNEPPAPPNCVMGQPYRRRSGPGGRLVASALPMSYPAALHVTDAAGGGTGRRRPWSSSTGRSTGGTASAGSCGGCPSSPRWPTTAGATRAHGAAGWWTSEATCRSPPHRRGGALRGRRPRGRRGPQPRGRRRRGRRAGRAGGLRRRRGLRAAHALARLPPRPGRRGPRLARRGRGPRRGGRALLLPDGRPGGLVPPQRGGPGGRAGPTVRRWSPTCAACVARARPSTSTALGVPVRVRHGRAATQPHHRATVQWLGAHVPGADVYEITGAQHGAHLSHPDHFAALTRLVVERAGAGRR